MGNKESIEINKLKKNLMSYEYFWILNRMKKLNNEFHDGYIMKLIRVFLTLFDGLDIFIWIKWCILNTSLKKARIKIDNTDNETQNKIITSELEKLKRINNNIVDTTVIFKILLAMAIFYFSWYNYNFITYFIFYLAVTSFLSIPSAILQSQTRPKATSYMRSTVLGLFNYVELVLYFASLYVSYYCLEYIDNDNIINYAAHKIDYLYFSFITVSTIGFGHVKIVEGSYGYWFVIAQAFIFLMFVLIFFNINLSRITDETDR